MPDLYGSLAAATVYHSDRGNTAWAAAASDALRTAALVRGSFAIDAAYGTRFRGAKPGGQVLAWPRTDAEYGDGTSISGVPIEVEYAAYEAALRELASPRSMSPDVITGKIKKKVKVDVVEVEYATGEGTAEEQRPIALVIEGLLAGLLRSAEPPYALVV
jgi:hypothetical protein